MIKKKELILFEWVLVDNCNLSCSYCVNKGEYSQKPKSKMMYIHGREINIARKILEFSSFADNVIVNLTGGDPLLSEHFLDVIAILASGNNIQINLITNMKLLGNFAEGICELFPNMNIGGSIHIQYRSDIEITNLIDLLNAYKEKLNISLSQVNCNLSNKDMARVEMISKKTGMHVEFQKFIPPWTKAGRVKNGDKIRDKNFIASKGKRCCLGYSHFLLLPNGSFCHGLWCTDRHNKVSDFHNISQEIFSDLTLNEMMKCPASSCGCNYNLFHHRYYSAACQRLNYPEDEIFGESLPQSSNEGTYDNEAERWFRRILRALGRIR